MHRHAALYAIILLLLFAAPVTTGQTQAGDVEVSFSLSLSEGLGSDFSNFTGNARFGVYVSDRVEVGGGLYASGDLDRFTETGLFETFVLYQLDPVASRSWYLRGGYLGLLDEPADGFADVAVGYKVGLCEGVRVFAETSYGTAVGGDLDGDLVRSSTGVLLSF